MATALLPIDPAASPWQVNRILAISASLLFAGVLVDLVNPPLTTIRPPHRELGWRAAQLLFERLDGQQLSAATVVLRPELVVRASTRPLQGAGA